jgi:hypothetical protein
MKYLKLLCWLGMFFTNRYALFITLFFFSFFLGQVFLPNNIYEIYFYVHIILFPFIFYLFELTIFREFDDHRRFFKNFLKKNK